jgi:hypothetical protein
LLKLAQLTKKRENLAFRRKSAAKLIPIDFQEHLITSLLLMCKKAEFLNLPLEQPKVPKSSTKCDQLSYTHFQKMPTLRFKFAKESTELIRNFMLNLDQQAETFDIEEKQGFQDQRFLDPIQSRNAYLNQ